MSSMATDKKYDALVKKYSEQITFFGENVKIYRQRRKLTQKELAEECNLDVRTIQRIENGQITVKLPVIFVLAEALKIQLNSLFKDINL